jgi:ribosomal protein S18 acetylase RimI-like enzyme
MLPPKRTPHTVDLIITLETDPAPYWDMLLLADPSKALVEAYLEDGKLYVAEWDDVVLGVFILMPLDDPKWELKNIAVAEEWQGKGVGKALIKAAINTARDLGAEVLEVGTGNSSLGPLAFYQKAGFRMQRIAKNYFTLNYDEPIFENGIQCRDMLILSQEL